MAMLLAGMIAFFGIHVVPCWPSLRGRLIETVGQNAYRGAHSIIAAAGLVLMIIGYAHAPRPELWAAPAWGPVAAVIVVPLALMLVAGAYIGSNIKRVTRHPMLWGIVLWAAVHLLNNGDGASVMLFGGFAVYALLDMVSANRRGARKATEPVTHWRDAWAVAVGLVAGGLIANFHEALFGVAIRF